MTDRIPFRVKPMLASLVKEPFDAPGWVYEEKYDGYRILAYKEGREVTLLSRNGNDRTATFAPIASAVAKLPARTLLLDGEVVIFDSKWVSRFQLLQNSGAEPSYGVFDCLYLDGRDLRREPLSARRAALEKLLGKTSGTRDRIFTSVFLAANGLKAFEVAKKKGYEGLVAKDSSAPYLAGRSRSWLKVKVHQEDEFLIVGYTEPEGARKHFGALLLAAYSNGDLRYVGKVGTGFNQKSLADLYRKFQPLIRVKAAVIDPPRERGITYLAPRLVAQIAYGELTHDRKLRQPVFLGLRDDKSPQDVKLPEVK
ncbi:MAG TPA: non-homologous end-joining DNA ligase [Bryobacteraceae bacterium]|nr:non-homologous end-joining DNA ligase [Bryobacteraceae bacterium]